MTANMLRSEIVVFCKLTVSQSVRFSIYPSIHLAVHSPIERYHLSSMGEFCFAFLVLIQVGELIALSAIGSASN